MRSPFPGMDPFIETSGLWGDFHDSLSVDIKTYLAGVLPENYFARIRRRSNVEFTDPDEGDTVAVSFEPDVSVKKSVLRALKPSTGAAATVAEDDPQAFDMHGLLENEDREIFVDIMELKPEHRLVTSIEILSPSNKRVGTQGWHLYLRKRQVFLRGYANLVEIDLLRGGRRFPMAEAWPSSPYTLLTLRMEFAPRCRVRPAYSLQPLPDLAIPLHRPDGDILLPLQALVDSVYEQSRYAREIDYRQSADVALSPDEKHWLDEKLGEQNRA